MSGAFLSYKKLFVQHYSIYFESNVKFSNKIFFIGLLVLGGGEMSGEEMYRNQWWVIGGGDIRGKISGEGNAQIYFSLSPIFD